MRDTKAVVGLCSRRAPDHPVHQCPQGRVDENATTDVVILRLVAAEIRYLGPQVDTLFLLVLSRVRGDVPAAVELR